MKLEKIKQTIITELNLKESDVKIEHCNKDKLFINIWLYDRKFDITLDKRNVWIQVDNSDMYITFSIFNTTMYKIKDIIGVLKGYALVMNHRIKW